MAAVDVQVAEEGEKVFVFGNAPTACFVCWSMMSRSTA